MSRQYLAAAKLVEEVLTNGSSLKSISANSRQTINKVEYALAAETIKYSTIIKRILNLCSINELQLDVQLGLLFVMSYELLFGQGKINGGGEVKRRIMVNFPAMKSALDEMMVEKSNFSELLSSDMMRSIQLPQYIRINELKIAYSDGIKYINEITSQGVVDEHIPCLIKFPHNVNSFGQDMFVKEGNLIIQDKASCFPSQVLADLWDSGDVIDACAAPGNKTSHMASQISQKLLLNLNNKSIKIYAFDKNPNRAKLLKSRMAQSGATSIVDVSQLDFLTVDIASNTYIDVQSILVDPSCSGSGVIRSWERVLEFENKQEFGKVKNNHSNDGKDINRLNKLRNFQIMVLKKALSFPSVKNIVYSTCSIHMEENESVVAEILSEYGHQNSNNGKNSYWKLIFPSRFSNWTRRGLECDGLTENESKCLLRCLPEDGMNGFFVATFQKVDGSDSSLISTESNKINLKENYNIIIKNNEKNNHKKNEISQMKKLKRKRNENVQMEEIDSSNSNNTINNFNRNSSIKNSLFGMKRFRVVKKLSNKNHKI
eukprot:gene7610-10361_t